MEPGDNCTECETGVMHYELVENCSCHINPPCPQCTNNPLVCDRCGYEEDE